jgi:hypothetical protein
MESVNSKRAGRLLGSAFAMLIWASHAGAQTAKPGYISTVAGAIPNEMPAVNANLSEVADVAIDVSGNIYFGSFGQSVVYKLAPSGILTIVAGTGVAGYGGDGGPATAAQLNGPNVAVDAATPANLYIADSNNCLVRKVEGSTGIITTIGGLVIKPATGNPYPSCGYGGDGGAADHAQFNALGNVAVNPLTGDVYVGDWQNGRVRLIAGGSATGKISTVAGGGPGNTAGNCQGSLPFGDGSSATSAYLCNPVRISLDTTTSPVNFFITDNGHCTIREVVGKTGTIYDVAGNYNCGYVDGVKATSGEFNGNTQQLHATVAGATTSVVVTDPNNARIRQFTLTYSGSVPEPGTLTTIAGGNGGYCGDGGPALGACIDPFGITSDAAGNFYIGDWQNNRVRKFKAGGSITTIAGWASAQFSNPVGLGKTTPATGVGLYAPVIAWADPTSNNVYVGGWYNQAIYVYNSTTGLAQAYTGNGVAGFAGDGGAANGPATELNGPQSLVKDSVGNVYIADLFNCAIREVSATTGDITTFAGGTAGHLNGCGYSGDGGPASKAQFNNLNGLATDSNDNLYVADYNNCVIRKIALATGIVTTVAGNSKCGYAGDDGPATSASLNAPAAVAVDGFGDLFIADQNNGRVREVDPFGTITTLVSGLNTDTGVAADSNGNVFIADQQNHVVRWVDPAGESVIVAGTLQSAGFSGDGGLATGAQLNGPTKVSLDVDENIYVSDLNNNRVRRIAAIAGYGRSTERLIFDKQQLGTTSGIQPIMLSAIGPVTISNVSVSAGFGEVDDCAGVSLAAGATCEIDVTFSPLKAGITDGLVTITSDAQFANQGSTVELVGEGGGLAVSGSLNFPTQPIGTATSKAITLTNTGTAATLTRISLATSSSSFALSSASTCPLAGGTLATNASCTVVVSFDASTVGSFKDTVIIASKDPSSPLLVGVTGSTTQVTLSPTSLAFGAVGVDGTATLNLTVTSSAGSLTLSPAILGAGFTILATGNTCAAPIAAGGKCNLPVAFTPGAVQAYSGSLSLLAGESGSPTVALTGTGVAAISVTPTSIAFTSITHGTSETSNVTIKNTGGGALTVTPAISGTGAASFSIAATGNTCGTAIPAGKTCTLPVTFAPAKAQAYAATLTLSSNGGASPTVALSGTGK